MTCFQEELGRALVTLNSPAGGGEGEAGDATEATAPTLQALAAAMVLLRRCRVNAALTIQLFSHLFHYINAYCFNKVITKNIHIMLLFFNVSCTLNICVRYYFFISWSWSRAR